MRSKYRMALSFSKWLVVSEVFRLDLGHVLTLAEALELSPEAQARIDKTKSSYQPGPHASDHLVAAVLGYKPAAIVLYAHHPESPAAAIVTDAIKKGDSDRIQAELLRNDGQSKQCDAWQMRGSLQEGLWRHELPTNS